MFAPLLEQRIWGVWIVGAAATHLALASAGHSGLGCPVRELTGLRCPGCGLTTACLDILAGRWRLGLSDHPFGPVFLLGAAVILLATILPAAPRTALARCVAQSERQTGMSLWLGAALVVYGIGRVCAG